MKKETNKFLEASLEGAEVIVDSLINNDIVKSIPVVGTALKLISGSLDLRDKIFLSKVQRFIIGIESISIEERQNFKRHINADKESLTAAGETVLLVLDRLSDLKKAELLGFYFSCFLSDFLDQYQYRRVAAAIDAGFIDDIDKFLKLGRDEMQSKKHFMEALFGSGMTAMSAGKTVDDLGEIFYEPSSMGRHMIELWQKHKQS